MFNFDNFLKVTTLLLTTMVLIITGNAVKADVIFVSGDVSGVWDADSVMVADSVRIPAGETLIIEPGVEVFFLDYYKFEIMVGAVLEAVGTEEDSIKFVPLLQSGRSLGLDFINASDQSILEYCCICDALTAGVHLNNSDITIRNSLIENSMAPSGSDGGGAVELVNGSDALIEYNTFRNNEAYNAGGAIYISNSSPIIKGNIIDNNMVIGSQSSYGGGIACYDNSNPDIIENTISNNRVHGFAIFSDGTAHGGGIYCSGNSNAVIAGNVIDGNVAESSPETSSNGGGMYITSSDPLIANNVITNNEAEGDNGGGIYFYQYNSEIVNNTFAYNVAGHSGGAVYFSWSNVVIVNAIMYFNEALDGDQIFPSNSDVSVSYSDIEGGWTGNENLDVDPLFRDAAYGDFHLQDSEDCGDEGYSPLIDVGSPGYSDILLDCNWGLGTDLSDIGAYGGGELIPVSVDDNFVEIPNDYFVARNYPNPFNASTTISYTLPEASYIKIDIYDELGRKVRTLIDEWQTVGKYNIVWNAAGNATGMYFYRILAGEFTETKKMVLLK